MNAQTVLVMAAANGFAAVGLGAFGAHGLKNKISENLLSAYQTGVQYHFYHTLALLGVAVLMFHFGQKGILRISASLFLLGMLMFSGSLYGLALSGPSWLGPITPLGGVVLLAGWASLLLAALKLK